MTSSIALEVVSLSHFEGAVPILKDISFEAPSGRVLGIIGPNGAGKSTLLRKISGVLEEPSGVRVDGRELSSMSQRERAAEIAYVSDDCVAEFPLTAEQAVVIGSYPWGASRRTTELHLRCEESMKRTGCYAYRDRPLSHLSGGERQRVALARALLQGSRILCLDESFSKLDAHHQVKMGQLIRDLAREGYTLLMVSHDLNFTTRWSDDVILLSQGKVVASGPTQKTVTIENLEKLYPGARIDTEIRGEHLRVYFTSSSE